jgi:hypothetical protein
MNIKDLRIYRNNIEDISQLEVGEIYALLYCDRNITIVDLEKHDTEVILKISEINLIGCEIKFNVILSRYIIPEDCSDTEAEDIISNWENDCEDWWKYKSSDFNGNWSINNDGSFFIKFDEYQEYLNNKTKEICHPQEEDEING